MTKLLKKLSARLPQRLSPSHIMLSAANFGSGIEPVSPLGKNSTTKTGTLHDFEGIISNVIGVLTVVAGLFFILFFVMAGIKWVTAGGESSKVAKARDEMVQGVVGLFVVVAAYGMIGLIGAAVGLDLLNPAIVLDKIIPVP